MVEQNVCVMCPVAITLLILLSLVASELTSFLGSDQNPAMLTRCNSQQPHHVRTICFTGCDSGLGRSYLSVSSDALPYPRAPVSSLSSDT
jgi:hypothetical protein